MALTAIAFVLAFIAGLALCVFRDPRYGLYTYVAVFYLHPPSRWWGAFLPDMRWSLLAAAVTLFATLRYRDAVRGGLSDTFGKVLLIYVVWMWCQFFWALDFALHLEGVVLFTKYLVLFWLVYSLMKTHEDVYVFLLLHVAGCFYFGYLGWIAPPGGRLEGVGGPGLDSSNPLGMHMATGAICAGMLLLSQRGWKFWFALVAAPFILITIVQAGSRGAFVGLVVAGLFVFAMRPKTLRLRFYAFAALGVILFALVAHENFWARMGTVSTAVRGGADAIEEMPDQSMSGRLALLAGQFQMAWDHPLGVGHRGTQVLSTDPRYLDSRFLSSSGVRSSHNTTMAVLVDQGVVGGILWLMLLASAFSRFAWLRRYQRGTLDFDVGTQTAAVGGAMVVVLVAGLFTNYLKAEVFIWMLAMLARLTELAGEKVPAALAPESSRPYPVYDRPAAE